MILLGMYVLCNISVRCSFSNLSGMNGQSDELIQLNNELVLTAFYLLGTVLGFGHSDMSQIAQKAILIDFRV